MNVIIAYLALPANCTIAANCYGILCDDCRMNSYERITSNMKITGNKKAGTSRDSYIFAHMHSTHFRYFKNTSVGN